MYLQYLDPGFSVGHRDVYPAVESTGPEQRGVDYVRPVRGTYHDDVLQLLQAVHLGEDLVDHALGYAVVAGAPPPPRCYCVQLVEEDDCRGGLPCLLEGLADALLGLTYPLAQELGALDVYEVRLGFVGYCLRDQCLSGAGRTVQQHALGRLYTHAVEPLGLG